MTTQRSSSTQVAMRLAALRDLALALVLSIAAEPAGAGGDVHWGYEGEHGPAHWGELSEDFEACSEGRNQSPVDIVGEVEAELPAIQLAYTGKTTAVVNNGHTLQVEVTPGNVLRVEGEELELLQFHFHSPSENQIHGVSFPLSVHFVHRDAKGDLAVLGLVFREGHADASLARIWDKLPSEAGDRAALELPLAELDFLPVLENYYRYTGSLTTPPCTEGVRWYVMEATRPVGAGQVAAFVKVFGENARPPQPLGSRLVIH